MTAAFVAWQISDLGGRSFALALLYSIGTHLICQCDRMACLRAVDHRIVCLRVITHRIICLRVVDRVQRAPFRRHSSFLPSVSVQPALEIAPHFHKLRLLLCHTTEMHASNCEQPLASYRSYQSGCTF